VDEGRGRKETVRGGASLKQHLKEGFALLSTQEQEKGKKLLEGEKKGIGKEKGGGVQQNSETQGRR